MYACMHVCVCVCRIVNNQLNSLWTLRYLVKMFVFWVTIQYILYTYALGETGGNCNCRVMKLIWHVFTRLKDL